MEHLIGASQKGYLKDIRKVLTKRLGTLSTKFVAELAKRIDEANTVTACSFCNSTTSRDAHSRTMEELILDTPGEADQVLHIVTNELADILKLKQNNVMRMFFPWAYKIKYSKSLRYYLHKDLNEYIIISD